MFGDIYSNDMGYLKMTTIAPPITQPPFPNVNVILIGYLGCSFCFCHPICISWHFCCYHENSGARVKDDVVAVAIWAHFPPCFCQICCLRTRVGVCGCQVVVVVNYHLPSSSSPKHSWNVTKLICRLKMCVIMSKSR